jgi:hypothetical protein
MPVALVAVMVPWTLYALPRLDPVDVERTIGLVWRVLSAPL